MEVWWLELGEERPFVEFFGGSFDLPFSNL
jgi:hypothetical protein